MNQPTSNEIYQARLKSELSVKGAADLVYVSRNTWNRWEGGEKINLANWELFQFKTGMIELKKSKKLR